MEVEVAEDLKLAEDDEWDGLCEDACQRKIKLRDFKAVLHDLKSTGPADSSMSNHLPIRDNNAPRSPSHSFKKAASGKSNKRKIYAMEGNMASMKDNFSSNAVPK